MVLLGDAARDGESQAVAGLGGVEPDEAFEDAFALAFSNAGAVVRDPRLEVSVEPPQPHVDSPVGRDGGEGVVDEVTENTFEGIGVTTHGGVVGCAERDRRVRCAPSCVLDKLACDRGEVA